MYVVVVECGPMLLERGMNLGLDRKVDQSLHWILAMVSSKLPGTNFQKA